MRNSLTNRHDVGSRQRLPPLSNSLNNSATLLASKTLCP